MKVIIKLPYAVFVFLMINTLIRYPYVLPVTMLVNADTDRK